MNSYLYYQIKIILCKYRFRVNLNFNYKTGNPRTVLCMWGSLLHCFCLEGNTLPTPLADST